MVINDFIENVARPVLSGENDEIRFVCCIANQSPIELHGRRLNTNFGFIAWAIDGRMNKRIKEIFIWKHWKKGLG